MTICTLHISCHSQISGELYANVDSRMLIQISLENTFDRHMRTFYGMNNLAAELEFALLIFSEADGVEKVEGGQGPGFPLGGPCWPRA